MSIVVLSYLMLQYIGYFFTAVECSSFRIQLILIEDQRKTMPIGMRHKRQPFPVLIATSTQAEQKRVARNSTGATPYMAP